MSTQQYLSKSLYTKGVQCHKALWLQKYRLELQDEVSDSLQARFDIGTDIGLLAQQIFPEGVEVPYEGLSHQEQLDRTAQLLSDGIQTIYEATFSFDNTFCKVDILHLADDGWELYEVKNSTGQKEIYLHDIAVQYHILSGSGYQPVRAFLVHINNQYERNGEINVHELFTVCDLTDEVMKLQKEVQTRLAAQRSMLAGEMPVIDIGPHCEKPYSCSFSGHCWGHIPENSVFELRGYGRPDPWSLYRSGILKIVDIPEDLLGWRQKLQQRGVKETFQAIEQDEVTDFLSTLQYPLCFMDFETSYLNPVPLWDGIRPYQQVPFQFSLHIVDEPGSTPRHIEYLAEADNDPRPGFIRELVQSVPDEGTIIVWNMTFESGRLQELADAFPESSPRLLKMVSQMVDLMVLFRNKSIYHSGFKGSYSIKAVLPALIPELTYKGMEIGSGDLVANEWQRMIQEQDPNERLRIRQNLLDYCCLDTLAMVKIVEKIRHSIL